jgi:Uncharacterized protein conserved in bacteria (DUF2169)
MWTLANRTAYAAERNWIRDKDGAHIWVVAVRATFDISQSGKLMLSDDQPPPPLAPEYFGEPGASSLRLDSDLLALKPGSDFVLDAHAHAPGGRLAASVPVSARVGDLEKKLVVHGMRVYYRGALGTTTSAPRPFTTHPIRYEWAFGGTDVSDPEPRRHKIDLRNPIGKGVASDPNSLVHQCRRVLVGRRFQERAGRLWPPRSILGAAFGPRREVRRTLGKDQESVVARRLRRAFRSLGARRSENRPPAARRGDRDAAELDPGGRPPLRASQDLPGFSNSVPR